MTAVDTNALTAAEADLLAAAEAVIARGLITFFEVGDALMQVRENRLYRGTHATFEAYCREQWGFSDSRARQLIGAAQTVTNVTEAGLPAPANEGQARALNTAPEDQRAEVWAETIDRTGGKPTAAAVAETVQARPRWKCAGCGEVSQRPKPPANCPTCQSPAHEDLVEALREAGLNVPPIRQLALVTTPREGVEFHRVLPDGAHTSCGGSTTGAHVLPIGGLVKTYSSTACPTCWPPRDALWACVLCAHSHPAGDQPATCERCGGTKFFRWQPDPVVAETLEARAAAAAEARRWECWSCAHTWTAPTDPGTSGTSCPKCQNQSPVNLGPDEPDDVDEHPADTAWHCDSCGRTRVQRPAPCPTCGAKTGFVAPGPTAHNIDPDGRCLTCGPPGNPRERVYTAWLRDGQDFHRLTHGGKKTVCGANTGNGHITPLGRLRQLHAVEPCEYGCYPAAAAPAATDEPAVFDGVHRVVRTWHNGGVDNGAGKECACGTILDGFTTVSDASAVMDRHIAEANAATDEPDEDSDDEQDAPAEPKHCEKCKTPLGEETTLMGYLRCGGCDSEGDHVSIDGGPCTVCTPDSDEPGEQPPATADPAELVYVAALRQGSTYHRLAVADMTTCGRSRRTGHLLDQDVAAKAYVAKPCPKCWPDGDPRMAAAVAEPVLEGEIVSAGSAAAEPAPTPVAPLTETERKALDLMLIRGGWIDHFVRDFDKATDLIADAASVSGWPMSEMVAEPGPSGITWTTSDTAGGLIIWDRIRPAVGDLVRAAPQVHFQMIKDACDTFDHMLTDVDTDLAVAGFDPRHAHRIEQAIALGHWLEEFMDQVRAKPRTQTGAPVAKSDGQMPGQLDILTEGVPGADR